MTMARLVGLMSDHDEDESVRPCTRALAEIGDATRARVLSAISAGGLQTAEIASAANIRYSTAHGILRALESRGEVTRCGRYRGKWIAAQRGQEWNV